MYLKLGSYVQLFEETKNIQHISSVGAVVLNPSNEKGVYDFLLLGTGRKLHGLYGQIFQ